MQAQIEERAKRSWKLRGMLHLGNLNAPGSTLDGHGYLMQTAAPPMKTILVTRPTLVGKPNFAVVEVVSGKWVATGMPNRKQKGPKNQKWLTKAIFRDKNSGVTTWQEPLVYSSSLKLTLVNQQLPRKDPRRLALQTLRVMNKFHGKPTRDNVKVEIAQDNGNSFYYFAQCEAFFQDGKGRTYVALRWHDQSGPEIIDVHVTVLLSRLKLRPYDQPRSYSVLPASCIHNGALVMARGAHHHAIMPHQQLKEYVSFNSAEA
jgi:hypothetical protein